MKIFYCFKCLLVFFACLLIVLGVFVFYSTRPDLDPLAWPVDGIIQEAPPKPLTLTPKPFSLATYNIGYASGQKNNDEPLADKNEMMKNLNAIIAAIKQTNADVIALQEVDFDAARSFHVNQMEIIAKALDIPYRAYVTTWNLSYLPFPYWPIKKHFGSIVSGQCVLSKHPILSQKIHRFNKPTANPFWYNWFYLDRVMQQVRIQVGDQIATVWNVHLEAFDKQARQEQALFVAQTIHDDSSVIKIALGDFNSASQMSDPSHSQFERETITLFESESGLKKAQTSQPAFTFPSQNPTDKIDHIFIPFNLAIESIGTINSMASDHLPVWAIIHSETLNRPSK